MPLVIRVLATAARSGVTSVVVVRTSATPSGWIRQRLQSPLISALPIHVVGVEPPFDATDSAYWSLLARALEPSFLWLPWNHVTLRRSLASIISAGPRPGHGATDEWDRPAVVVTDALLTRPAIGRRRDARGTAAPAPTAGRDRPDRPEPFHDRFEDILDSDSSDPVSPGVQKMSGLAKKGVTAHYVVRFSVLGLLPVFVGLATFGSVLTLAIVLFASQRFFGAPGAAPVGR